MVRFTQLIRGEWKICWASRLGGEVDRPERSSADAVFLIARRKELAALPATG
jgi:hypothetical protein